MNNKLDTVLKGYLFAYLNEFNANSEFCIDKKNRKSYKEFKIKQVARYLNVPSKFFHFFSFFSLILSKFEVIIYIIILFVKFFIYTFQYVFSERKSISNKYIMLGLNLANDRFVNILKSANIDIDNVVIVKLPSIKSDYNGFEKVNMFSGINYSELFYSFIYAIKVSFIMKKKYGNRDLMFRSYTSFEYFLSFFYLKRSDTSNDYYFVSLLDRWAYLSRYIKKNKCLIQHGILYENMKIKKIGDVDIAYYINEKQRFICEKSLLTNKPKAYYRSSIKFSSNNKLLNNGLKNVLLICNKFFFEKENKIINDLGKRNLNLYIKPHPVDKDITVYTNLLKENDFMILDQKDFPKVDFAISYVSTLADEYESEGVKVLRYDDDDFDFLFNGL